MRALLARVLRLSKLGFAAVALMIGAGTAVAMPPEVYQSGQREIGFDAAVGGFDVVAYHTVGKAVPGQKKFWASWKDATWMFSSEENLNKFLAEPEKYAPQYGGYCAYGVANGSLVHGDPHVFNVINGKLYLNISSGVQLLWRLNQSGFITQADQRWPQLLAAPGGSQRPQTRTPPPGSGPQAKGPQTPSTPPATPPQAQAPVQPRAPISLPQIQQTVPGAPK